MGILGSLRRVLVRQKDRLDRALHPRRRRRVLKRLAEEPPASVLFICLGNVCRSPYAERVFRERFDGTVRVESAGFIKPGRTPPDTALSVARDRGIDHADHQSRVASREMLLQAEAVFFFDRYNRRDLLRAGAARDRIYWLGDLDTEWEGKRAIIDPWGKEPEEFQRVFSRIERCVRQIPTPLGRVTH